jgi:hypothetical protein
MMKYVPTEREKEFRQNQLRIVKGLLTESKTLTNLEAGLYLELFGDNEQANLNDPWYEATALMIAVKAYELGRKEAKEEAQ